MAVGHNTTAQTTLGPSAAASGADTPTDQLNIRAGQAGDAAAIAALGREVFRASFGHSCSKADMDDYLNANFTESIMAAELEDKDRQFLVADVGGTMAAFSLLTTGTSEPCLEHIPQADRIELQRIYTDNAFHGKGIAKALLIDTLDLARRQGFTYIWLGVWEDNSRAQAFYNKFGFERVGEHTLMVGGDAQTDWILLKRL